MSSPTIEQFAAGAPIGYGSKGEAVELYQGVLNNAGFTDSKGRRLVEDGNWGPNLDFAHNQALLKFGVRTAQEVVNKLNPASGGYGKWIALAIAVGALGWWMYSKRA